MKDYIFALVVVLLIISWSFYIVNYDHLPNEEPEINIDNHEYEIKEIKRRLDLNINLIKQHEKKIYEKELKIAEDIYHDNYNALYWSVLTFRYRSTDCVFWYHAYPHRWHPLLDSMVFEIDICNNTLTNYHKLNK